MSSYIFLTTAVPRATSISNSLGVDSKRLNALLTKLSKPAKTLSLGFYSLLVNSFPTKYKKHFFFNPESKQKQNKGRPNINQVLPDFDLGLLNLEICPGEKMQQPH